jgi:8-oxo-dGTP pyrophosphatase MutT (NUDIX family)
VADPTRTQRLGAYAVVVHDGDLLLTRISPVGYPAGFWNLPGGGVEHGESPNDTVVRELREETGLEAITTRLIDVASNHVVEAGRNDEFEDYHGIALLYVVSVDTSIEPCVLDVGGTTDVVRWVPLAEVGSADFPVISIVEHALDRIDQFVGG